MGAKRKYADYDSTSRLYNVWAGMKARCFCKNHRLYKHYGGRGITVCKEWLDYETFKEWAINNGYTGDGDRRTCTIDRVDVNGNYEPSNCRWASVYEQLNNKRTNVKISYKGETKTLSQWAATLGINYSTMTNRYVRGWSVERMLTQPVKPYRKGA